MATDHTTEPALSLQGGDLVEVPAWGRNMYLNRTDWPNQEPTALELCEVIRVTDLKHLILAIPKYYGGESAEDYNLKIDKCKRLQHNFCSFNKNAFIRKVEGHW